MNRKLIGVTTFAAVILAGMLILAVLMGGVHRRYQAERVIEEYHSRLALMDAEALHRHQMLAKWYNFCLGSKEPHTTWQDAYQGIWNVSNGMMGYLELPDGNISIPIYHNAIVQADNLEAGHVPGSALPVGGRGNHTLLTVPAEAVELREGNVFCIHIPGEVLYYSVREIRTVLPGQTDGVLPVEGEDLCTLTAMVQKGTDTRKILIHGIRSEPVQEESMFGWNKNTLRGVMIGIIGTLFIPVVTGVIGWLVRRVYRKWNCKRLTNNMT